MRRGIWHQIGHNNQRIIDDVLKEGVGNGVIISVRDLSFNKAVEYAASYREEGADILVDTQFYVPEFSNRKIDSYGLGPYRKRISDFGGLDLPNLTDVLIDINRQISTNGILAPCIIYEAGRPDIIELNARLFHCAKEAANELDIPTYATIVLGNTLLSSYDLVLDILNSPTTFDSDGWIFSIEFNEERLPYSYDLVNACCRTGLTLACTGKPVMHSFAGPLSLLSLGFGATATTIGHFQNLWQFDRTRWQEGSTGGGGGGTTARFFSEDLWSTIVYPDEFSQLSQELRNRVYTASPFSEPVSTNGIWKWWDSFKHLVYSIGSVINEISEDNNIRNNAQAALNILDTAIELHGEISATGIVLKDHSNRHQNNWHSVLSDVMNSEDYEFLEMLKSVSV